MPNRYSEAIMKAIWDAYAPSIKGDPVYIGPLIDGLTLFIPELLVRPDYTPSRRRTKLFLMDTSAEPGMARQILSSLSLKRQAWVEAGLPPTLLLSNRVLNVEPGEILNSVMEVQDDFGAAVIVDTTTQTPTNIKIREEKKYGLHYLLRGDELEAMWRDRQNNLRVLRFSLKPLSEGSSLILPAQERLMASY